MSGRSGWWAASEGTKLPTMPVAGMRVAQDCRGRVRPWLPTSPQWDTRSRRLRSAPVRPDVQDRRGPARAGEASKGSTGRDRATRAFLAGVDCGGRPPPAAERTFHLGGSGAETRPCRRTSPGRTLIGCRFRRPSTRDCWLLRSKPLSRSSIVLRPWRPRWASRWRPRSNGSRPRTGRVVQSWPSRRSPHSDPQSVSRRRTGRAARARRESRVLSSRAFAAGRCWAGSLWAIAGRGAPEASGGGVGGGRGGS